MYACVILGIDALPERARYGRTVTSARASGGPARPPVLYGLSERRWRALDGMVALFGLLAAELDLRSVHGSRAADISLALLACGAVAFRRRWPIESLAVVTIAVAGLAVVGQVLLPLGAMLSAVGYTVAARTPRRSSILALVGAEAACSLGIWMGFAFGHGAHGPVATPAIETFLPLVAAWFVGDSVAARQTYLAGLVEQAEQRRVTEAERARQAIRQERIQMARELHDVVAHSLAVITVQAGVGRRLMTKQPEQAIRASDARSRGRSVPGRCG